MAKSSLEITAPVGAGSQAEQALRESEARFRSVLESSRDAIYRFNVQAGRFEYISASAEKLVGFSLEELMALDSEASLSMIHPDDLPAMRAALAGLSETGKAEAEYRQVTKSGEYRWLSNQMSLTTDNAGRPLYRNGSIRDITEHKRAEQALRETEEQFRVLAQNLRSAIALVDERGAFTIVNNAFRRMFDIPQEADILNINNRDWKDWQVFDECGVLLSVDDHPVRKAALTRTAVKDQLVAVKPPSSSDLKWLLVSAEPIFDAQGGPQRLICTYYDITDRKAGEEALRHSRAALQAFYDSAPLMMGLVEIHGDEVVAVHGNSRVAALFGVTPDQLPGRLCAALNPNPEINALWLRAYRECLESNSPAHFEYHQPHAGGIVWISATAAPVPPAESGYPRCSFIAEDITERKRTEERLRQTQKLESVGLLAGGIAHDFNNLLTGVMGNASLLLEDAPAERAEPLRSIIAAAERASQLTRQLLAYSGKGQVVVRELDITQAVNEMADLVQFSIPKSVGLSLNLDRRLPRVEMDPGQLQQILMNLVINAGEAIGEGNPGKISVSTSMADIGRAFTDDLGEEIEPGRYVCIEVRDSGSGIEPDKKARIFDPFFTTKFLGRGLGLAAVAGILRSQKGGITVESAISQGTAFRVFLPAVAAGAPAVQEAASASGRPAILVVDDEYSVRDFIGLALRKKGYLIVQAADGQEALALLGSAPGAIDAAIVDIVMPNMSANELLPALKAKQPSMRILLTSGYSEAEARRLCAAYPGAAFIQKPYTAQQLVKAVGEMLAETRGAEVRY